MSTPFLFLSRIRQNSKKIGLLAVLKVEKGNRPEYTFFSFFLAIIILAAKDAKRHEGKIEEKKMKKNYKLQSIPTAL